MSDVKPGTLIDATAQRDAIHVALAPVVAAERLVPSAPIGFVDGSTELVSARAKTLIGIVDPFLTAIVEREERFWMFLYPQTITSLRHDWTHPAFTAPLSTSTPDQAKSREWVRSFAATYAVSYEEMMDAATAWARDGRYFSRGGLFEGESVPDEFWRHYQVITGKVVDNPESFFSCAC